MQSDLDLPFRASSAPSAHGQMEVDHDEVPVKPGRSFSGSRREREFRRYAEAVLGMRETTPDDTAVSGVDVPLTAFAQLVALRLHAKRVLVSLYDKRHQYILAEATATLSLQQDSDHDEGDAMFFGSQILLRSNDWFSETLQTARKHRRDAQSRGEDAVLMIPDLLVDDRYATHPYVAGAPFVRSYIGVPLLSPMGYAIGTLSVLDDKIRPNGVNKFCVKVLRDVATSIMSHLELARTKAVHDRATRMVQGLSRFIEGKDSLDDHPRHHGQSAEQVSNRLEEQSHRLGASARTHALNKASNIERIDDARVVPPSGGAFRAQSYREARRQSVLANAPPEPVQPDTITRRASGSTVSAPTPERQVSSDSASQLQQDLVSKNITHAFQRAATLVQQAMDLAGVLILDASAGEFGSLRNTDDTDVRSNSTDSGSGDNWVTYSGSARMSGTKKSKKGKPCRCLAAAHAENVDLSAHTQPVPEKFLRSLIRRFPHGRIYNFGEDGLLSSDDHSDNSQSGPEAAARSDEASQSASSARPKRRKRTPYTDSQDLNKMIPGIRSFAILPMWDNQRGRFRAGAIVWSYNPMRLFSFQDDLNYLSAFCDVLVTEVERLEVQADAKAKSTFIASVSHELRSPLHGILGGAEFLQEDDDDPSMRQQMVQVIDSCGRSLLDIVNNLLEHAHAAAGEDTAQTKTFTRRRTSRPNESSEPVQDLAILTEEVLASMLHSNPTPAKISQPSSHQTSPLSPTSEEPVKVILDIDVERLPPSGWNFHVNAGAYRRILQNLASNAMKYTDCGGFCRCRLSILQAAIEGKPTTIELECADSGKGMSQEYLRTGLWQAFNQEDSHAQGTGLGLNLVHNLVKDMGGTIDVRSTKGVGTSIKVLLPMFAGRPSGISILESEEATAVRGLAYKLIGFEGLSAQAGNSGYGKNLLRTSIMKTCQYLGLQPSDGSMYGSETAQIAIVTERQALAAARLPPRQRPTWHNLPCVVLCDSVTASRSASLAISDAFRQAITVSQPLGPRQLLQSLTLCLNRPPQDTDRHTMHINTDTKASYSGAPTPASEASGMSWAPKSPVPTPSISGTTDGLDVTSPELRIEDQLRRTTPPLFRRPTVRASASSVLVVDDNSVNLTLLERYMTKLKRIYVGATNGQEALDAYKDNHASDQQDATVSPTSPTSSLNERKLPISVIFMDITMPLMDGLEASRRIRAYERAMGLRPVMIVALTALASPHARQEAYSSGIDLFLTKPVRFKDIEQMFRDWEVEIG